MSGTFVDQFIPERDNLVFSIAGILYSLGWWAYAFGVASPSGVPEHPYQFDAVSIVPGMISTLSLLILNLFSTRRHLQVESWNMFATATSRTAKLLVFIFFCLNLGSIGLAVIMGSINYGSKGMIEACFGLIAQSAFIITSSFTIYFGRVLSDSQFFD